MSDLSDDQVKRLAALVDAGKAKYTYDTYDTFRPVDGGVLQDVGAFVHKPLERRDDESDTEYRIRDDRAWRDVKRRAGEAGKSARRVAEESSSWLERAAASAGDKAQAALQGVDTAFLGAPSAIVDTLTGDNSKERLRASADRNPVTAGAASLVASLMPMSAVGKLGRIGSGFVQKVAPNAERLARMSLSGATAAGEAVAVNEITQLIDQAAGRESSEATASPVAAALTGSLGGFAKGATTRLRRELPELERLEKAGGRTSVLSGVKPGDRVAEVQAAARAGGVTAADIIQDRIGRLLRDLDTGAAKDAVRMSGKRARRANEAYEMLDRQLIVSPRLVPFGRVAASLMRAMLHRTGGRPNDLGLALRLDPLMKAASRLEDAGLAVAVSEEQLE